MALCSLPWCRKPIPNKRQCKRFPTDRPSQLAWLDALDAGTWFSIPPETLSTGLVLCRSHFDSGGNVKRRYEVPATYDTEKVKLEPQDFADDGSDEEGEDSYIQDNDVNDDPDYTSRSKLEPSRSSHRREIRVNIVHLKENTKVDGKRKRTSKKVEIHHHSDSEAESDFDISNDDEQGDPKAGPSRRRKTKSSLDTFDTKKLATMTEKAFRSGVKARDGSKANHRISLSLIEKMKIIRLSDRGLKLSQIADKMGLKKPTVWGVLSNREKIEEAYHGGASLRKKVRKGAYEEINQALYAWYLKVTSQNLFVNTRVLMTMAESIANELGRSDFKGSQGWLDRFKQRYNIRFGSGKPKPRKVYNRMKPSETCLGDVEEGEDKKCGREEDDVTSNAKETVEDQQVVRANEWLKHMWTESRMKNFKTNELYSEKDTFFVEEIGILYRITPKLAWEFRSGSDDPPEFSITDERLTVLLCSNADGTEKLELLVAGKEHSEMPSTLPVNYVVTSDSSNWITKPIFYNWLKKWNCTLESQSRKVLLLLSSTPIHTIKKRMSHINLTFIPSHHHSILQPASHGITSGFRMRYRRLLLEKLVEIGAHLTITCYDALFLLKNAWNEITPNTIRAAFVKAGFFPSDDALQCPNEVLEPDCINLLAKAAELGLAVSQTKYTFLDYLGIDDSLYAVECNVSGLLEEAHSPNDDTSSDEVNDAVVSGRNTDPVQCDVTASDALHHLACLKKWVISKPKCSAKIHDSLSALESFILRDT